MKHMRFGILSIIVGLWALPVMSEPIPLSEISTYLNEIETAKTQFQQVNDDGSFSSGTLWIKRPGRMRFEYDPPANALVLASAGTVAIFDAKSNQPPKTYALKRTPLSLLLLPDVDLEQADMVVGHAEQDGMTVITAQDPENPEYGAVVLTFSPAPLTLREWTVFDSAGGRTRVILEKFERGMTLRDAMFSIYLETEKNGGK